MLAYQIVQTTRLCVCERENPSHYSVLG